MRWEYQHIDVATIEITPASAPLLEYADGQGDATNATDACARGADAS